MANRQSSNTENILSINNIQRNKQGTSDNIVSTDNAKITTSGTISIGINPPESYGDNPGIYIGNEPVPVVSFYSDENNYLKWDGTKLLISSENFSLNSLGTIRAVNGEFTGIISASEGGNIAGWIIENNLLYSGSGSTTVTLDSSGGNPAFSAGSSVSSTAPFRIYPDGTLVATSASISGSLSAIVGNIGGWGIGASSIYSDNGDSALNSGITTGSPSIMLGATGYKTGSGVWFGKDTDGIYKFFAGNVSTGSYLSFNGSSLDVKGITADIATITTLVTVGSGSPFIYIDGVNKTIETSNFDPDSVGWKISSDGTAEFNNIKARGSIQTAVFIKDLISAHAGTLGVFKSAGKLLNNLNTSASIVDIDIDSTDLLFDTNDILRIKEYLEDNWFRVDSYADSGSYYTYTCTLMSGSATTYSVGATVVDYGQDTDGFLLMSGDSTDSPSYSVNTHSGSPWINHTEIARMGNMSGFLDVDSAEYGFGVGGSDIYLRYTQNRGLTIKFASGSGTIGNDGFVVSGINTCIRQVASNSSGSNTRLGTMEMVEVNNVPSWAMSYSVDDGSVPLITNGDFETGDLTGWSGCPTVYAVSGSAKYDGNYGLECWTKTGLYYLTSSSFVLDHSKLYKVSLMVNEYPQNIVHTGSDYSILMAYYDSSGSYLTQESMIAGGLFQAGWNYRTGTIKPFYYATYGKILITNSRYYMDNIRLETADTLSFSDNGLTITSPTYVQNSFYANTISSSYVTSEDMACADLFSGYRASFTGNVDIDGEITNDGQRIFPYYGVIFPDDFIWRSSNGGTIYTNRTPTTSQAYAMWTSQVSTMAAIDDKITAQINLAKGYYTIKIIGVTNSSGGQADLYVNGTQVNTSSIEFYSSGTTYNVIWTFNNVMITNNGTQTIKLTVTGKNGSSSNYLVLLSAISFQGTTLIPGSSGTYRCICTADTFITVSEPTTNYGNYIATQIGERNDGSGYYRRSLYKFDLSNIPQGEDIDSAIIRLCTEADFASNSSTVEVYPCLRNWVEMESTWNIYSTGNNWATAGGFGVGDYDATISGSVALTASETLNKYIDIPLNANGISLLEGWRSGSTNYGFIVKTAAESNDAYRYHSREATYVPELVVTLKSTPPIA